MDNVQTPILENATRLDKFYQYLNYEVGSSLLLVGLLFMPILLEELLKLAAILFTPYLIYVLYKEAKYGWITTFILIVLLPDLLLLVFAFQYNVFALLPFYFYCYILRLEAKNWLKEKRSRNELALQKIRKANKSNEFEDIFEIRN